MRYASGEECFQRVGVFFGQLATGWRSLLRYRVAVLQELPLELHFIRHFIHGNAKTSAKGRKAAAWQFQPRNHLYPRLRSLPFLHMENGTSVHLGCFDKDRSAHAL